MANLEEHELIRFQNITWTAYEIVKVSLSWAQQFEPFLNGSKTNPPNSVIHSQYEDNWVHLFSDGVMARVFKNAFAGGVVCDQAGNWILGFNHYLGKCSPFVAELWGILDRLLILLNKGYKSAYSLILYGIKT